jgi:transcriptional regulator with XRE-family HTH domain
MIPYLGNERLARPRVRDYICAATSATRGSVDVTTVRRQKQEAGGFAARLRQVLRAHGSASALAKAIGRSEGAVRKWLRGESEPNVTDLRAICEMTQTRIEWLASGQGPREAAGVADAAPADGGHALLDLRLLEAVMSAIDQQLSAADLELTAPKRSALIAAAYDLARDRKGLDAEAVARLVRLAR